MLFLLAAMLLDAPAPNPPDRPALTIRLINPRAQLERLIALFEGSRAPHPAAALAGYKRAKGGDTGLGKAVEAAIASINPGMAAEMATLDDATLGFGLSPDGRLTWNAVIPRDDGTFAAYATASVLTDGAADAPLDGLAVDRLGPKPTAALAARAPGGFLLANSRDALGAALRRSREPIGKPMIWSGCLMDLDPKGLQAAAGPVSARRAAVALAKLGVSDVDARIGLENGGLFVDIFGRCAAPPTFSRATIPARWLDAIPDEGTLAAFAFALDPSPAAWDATFDLLDAVEKADPARANVAPLRLRLDLLARAAGIRLDADLWPLLIGVSAIVGADASGAVDGVIVRLHAKDEAAADRLASLTIKRVVRAIAGPTRGGADEAPPVKVSGRPVAIERRDADVAITWGRIPHASRPNERGFGAAIGGKYQRFAAFWPGRLPSIAAPDAWPVIWSGRFDESMTVDSVIWPDLKRVVRRVVDRIPFDPPPDASTPPAPRG